jgi:nitrate reductase gamma subunit
MLYQTIIIRQLKIIVLFLVATVFGAPSVEAGWLIDHEKFHASVHGQNSCHDCHADINDRTRHPDPTNVNKQSSDFFDVEHCLACHDHILEDLDQGVHGSEKIVDNQSYEYCIECHPPHAELPPQDRLDTFDPDRPLEKQCDICHEHETELPPFASEDQDCMICHLQPDLQDDRAAEKINRLCLHCHDQTQTRTPAGTATSVPLINTIDDQKQPHAQIACNQCHGQAAAYKHTSQELADCSQCHPPHDEKVAHDAHIRVACEACHLQGVLPVRDDESKQILWKKNQPRGEPSRIHQLVEFDDESFCRRCHHPDNAIGAAALVLPAKSMLCMPCHAATLSLGDTTTILTLVLFLGGMVMTFSLIFSGTGRKSKNIDHSGKDFKTADRTGKFAFRIKTILWDVFFQRRLFRQSQIRWLIHGLIFFPLVIRFLWGLVALSASLTMPDGSWIWDMLDKNNALTGFLFDLTGLMILIGVILALIRGRVQRAGQVAGLPGQDRTALILIGSIVLVGFVLEGLRIAMTGTPDSVAYAFVGFSISRLFSPLSGLSNLYGYGWYLHAILTGIFIVYLPFSRLLHMILSPVVLAWNAVTEHK